MSEINRRKYTPMRKAISNAMNKSIHSGAQLTLGLAFDATNLLKARKKIKQSGAEISPTVNDIVIFALSRAIKQNPALNGIIGEGYFDEYSVAHIAVAVDTPKGLITPVVKDASEKSLNEIAQDTKALFKKAMDQKLTLEEIKSGTFTISNLGLSGVSFFTPILNSPQAALLGVGSPIPTLKMVDGEVVEFKQITLSLTMDHGPNDGAAGAKFVKEIATILENIDEYLNE